MFRQLRASISFVERVIEIVIIIPNRATRSVQRDFGGRRLGAGACGTISGTVTDPTGAVIKDAQITIRNKATGFERQTKSESDGGYFCAGAACRIVRGEDPGARFPHDIARSDCYSRLNRQNRPGVGGRADDRDCDRRPLERLKSITSRIRLTASSHARKFRNCRSMAEASCNSRFSSRV